MESIGEKDTRDEERDTRDRRDRKDKREKKEKKEDEGRIRNSSYFIPYFLKKKRPKLKN